MSVYQLSYNERETLHIEGWELPKEDEWNVFIENAVSLETYNEDPYVYLIDTNNRFFKPVKLSILLTSVNTKLSTLAYYQVAYRTNINIKANIDTLAVGVTEIKQYKTSGGQIFDSLEEANEFQKAYDLYKKYANAGNSTIEFILKLIKAGVIKE